MSLKTDSGSRPSDEKQHPLIPFKRTVNIRYIDKRIDKALVKLREYYGTTPTGSEFEMFLQDLMAVFLPRVLRYDLVYLSTMSLAGKEVTREVIKQTVWRLAANLDKLKKSPVPPWARQTELEWVSVKIVRASIGRNRFGQFGFHYDYRVLNGSPAGLRFRLFWSLKYVKFIARSLGFTRGGRGKYQFRDGSELVGMKLCFLLDPALSTDERPVHYHFYVPASHKTANQRLMKRRMRIIPCPKGFRLSEVACHHCPHGYDECPAGCHPFTWKIKPCPRCLAKEAWFDPAGRGVICMDCEDKEALAHDKEKSK